tara:strand:- start:7348 stop:8580 length:1233 start_codon:yes stop_codon:yes gene_type:complete
MSGTAIAQSITIAAMPLVTRLYTPEMIGVISVYLSFFNFWLTLLTWRYESALLITDDDDESHHVFRLGALLVLITALLAIPALGALQYFDVLGFEVLPVWASGVACLSSLGFGWFMLYRTWLLRLQQVKIISFSAVARSSANSIVRVIGGLLGTGVFGLFAAEILGSWSALGLTRNKTKKLLQSPSPEWSITKIKTVAFRYRRFAQYEMPSSVVNQLAIALQVPIVGVLYGTQAAGWFGLARLLYAIPNGQIGKAAADVFRMELGRYLREGNIERGIALFNAFTVRLALVGLIPLFIAIFAAPVLVPIIFGGEWHEMGLIVANMAPWMYALLVVSSMSVALSVLQRQDLKLYYDGFSLLLILFLYAYAEWSEIELLEFINYLSVIMVLSYIGYYFLIKRALTDCRRKPSY